MCIGDIKPEIDLYIELASNLACGKISFDEYRKERDLSPKTRFKEIGQLLENKGLFDLFMTKLPIGIRCLVMRDVFNLNYRQINGSTEHTSTTPIGTFIRRHLDGKDPFDKDSSFNLIYPLAIIFDIPVDYLVNHQVGDVMNDAFEEYQRFNQEISSFHELIEIIKQKMVELPESQRYIMGVKLNRNNLFIHEPGVLFTRVDIRATWFTIEIHFENKYTLNTGFLKTLGKSIGLKNRIYIRDAFLRDNKKLIILVTTGDSFDMSVKYLQENMLID